MRAKCVAKRETEKWVKRMIAQGKNVTNEGIKRVYENIYQMKLLRYEYMMRELGL